MSSVICSDSDSPEILFIYLNMHMVSSLDKAMKHGHKQTDVIIMDFTKAFDKVPHRRLSYKLDYYGIRGSTHKWIT